jgi:hypothetical protein
MKGRYGAKDEDTKYHSTLNFNGYFQLVTCRPGVLNFFQTGATFTPCYRIAGRKVINEDNLLKRNCSLLKMVRSRLGLLLQIGSHVAQYFCLTKSVIVST